MAWTTDVSTTAYFSDGGTKVMVWNSTVSNYVWNTLMNAIGNEYGVAAIMGNFYAESGLCPYRVQSDNTSGYTVSEIYTSNLISGAVSRYQFGTVTNPVINGEKYAKGYSFAQWTFSSRKYDYYDFHVNNGYTFGTKEGAVAFTLNEMPGYSNVWNKVLNATDVSTPSNVICEEYEGPAIKNYETRRGYSQAIYDYFHGSTPVDPPSQKYTVTLVANAGIDSVSGGGSYSAGQSVTVTAVVNSAYTFAGWRGSYSSSSNPYTFLMPQGNVTLQAYSTASGGDVPEPSQQFTVNLIAGTGIASVTGGGSYSSGEWVEVSATVQSGWRWVGWVGSHASESNPHIFIMPSGSITLTAVATKGSATGDKKKKWIYYLKKNFLTRK